MRILIATLLTASLTFAKKSEDVIIIKNHADFEKCLNDRGVYSDVCLAPYEDFAKSNPKEAVAAAKKVIVNYKHSAALKFFEMGLKSKIKGVCKDKQFHMAMTSALALPESYEENKMAQALFAGNCFADLLPIIEKELIDPTNSYLASATCPILKKKGKSNSACDTKPVVTKKEEAPEKLPTLDRRSVKIDATMIKTFKGPEGAKITFGPVTGTDLYLIKFEGFKSPWNGKTVLHKVSPNSGNTQDFWTDKEGQRWVTIAKRAPYGGAGDYTAYVPGEKEMFVYYSEVDSKSATAQSLLDSWK